MSGSTGSNLFHADHPRRLIPELSANCYRNGWFVGTGCGGFFSIKQGDSVYVAPSNVVKNRLEGNDLYVYKVADSSVTLLPSGEKKLEPCEILGLIMLIYKDRKGCGAVLHSNGQDPCLASLIYRGAEFKIKNQAAIKGIYNDSLKRNYNMDEELQVPIINVATETAMKQALKKYPHTHAIIVRNQGMFVWGETWQKCQSMAESYHFLMGLSVQMEKLGLNEYTHAATPNDVNSVNDSISSNAPIKEEPSKSPAKKASPAATQATATASPSPAASKTTTPTSAAKKTNGVTPKGSPLKKTSATKGGKVTKRGAAGGMRGGRGRGRGGRGNVRASPGPPGFGSPVNMPHPMMGPGPMAGPPMGLMGPPMVPSPLMGPGPMMRGLSPMRGGMNKRGARGRGAAGRGRGARGRGAKKVGARNKAGVTKDVLMNY